MQEKGTHVISAYCANIDFVKRILSANEIKFEERVGQIIITSPMDAGTESNIWGLFCVLNLPTPKFDYGTRSEITYYSMNIEKIIKHRECGIARHIYPKNLGNGMLFRFSNNEDDYWVVLDHEYEEKIITAANVKDIYADDGIFCDDVYFHSSKKSGEKKVEDFCEMETEQNLVFCGYVNLKNYKMIVENCLKSTEIKEYPLHDFEKFDKQRESYTSVY